MREALAALEEFRAAPRPLLTAYSLLSPLKPPAKVAFAA
jgi:hypothetical protein